MRKVPRLSKETSIFNGKAIEKGVNGSARTATAYLTESSEEGLMVHRSDEDGTGVRITDVVEILRDGESVAEYGETARIGLSDEVHLELDDASVEIVDGDGTTFVRMYRANPDDPYGRLETDDIEANFLASNNLTVRDFLQIGGQNIHGACAGSKLETLTDGQWLTLMSAAQVTSALGSGASQANTICIAQNGDYDVYAGVVTGAMGQDGSARAYIYPNRTGRIRINYLLVRFA